jgi:hypothetical protein
MKGIFTILFLTAAFFCSAQEFKSGTFLYRVTGENSVEVLSADKKMSGNVMIPQSVRFNNAVYDVTAVADTGFANCKGIGSLILPSKISRIGKRAFLNCFKLNSVNIPYGVKKIPEGVFCHCESLYGVSLPDGITEIGSYAFAGCNQITKLNLPDRLKTIGDKAFYNCEKIQALKIPAGVESIGIRAFQGCNGLIRLEAEEGCVGYLSSESVLYTKDLKHLVRYPAKKDAKMYTVLSGVKEIDEFAFENANDLIVVNLPSGLYRISNFAFSNCENLQKVPVPSSVRMMAEDSFFGSPMLEYTSLHGGVDFIEFESEKGMIEDLE